MTQATAVHVAAALNPSCRICGCLSRPAFMAGEHRMYRCDACGTAFVHPVPSSQQLAEFYARFHLSTAEGGNYDEVEGRIQADFPAKVELLRRHAGDGKLRLLDVGCGKGFFLKACAQ